MRDWKVFRPGPGAAASNPPKPLVRKRRSEVEEAPADTDPEFEIALDLDAEQLTLMFDDTGKYDERPSSGTIKADVDHQEAWRREALRARENVAETFGDWQDESRLEGATYYRKATRLS